MSSPLYLEPYLSPSFLLPYCLPNKSCPASIKCSLLKPLQSLYSTLYSPSFTTFMMEPSHIIFLQSPVNTGLPKVSPGHFPLAISSIHQAPVSCSGVVTSSLPLTSWPFKPPPTPNFIHGLINTSICPNAPKASFSVSFYVLVFVNDTCNLSAD